MGPLKKCLFWCNGPRMKAPQIPFRHQKKSFWRFLIEFGDTKKCHTFGGLELVPKRELAVSAACTRLKNAFKPFETIRKKFLLLKTIRNARNVRSLGKKNPFWGIPRG